ncbi:IS21 family transposase [Desulfobacula toluolica]|uniref:Integrase catalytic region n=1 Tax=Desulfobacula toluolica (strain DSM 7467 / Tol2) TaxID=651182 RepID=K0NCH4_DESTT|nr:IS21 family transposase [Desulfobacula toluolica]CCK78521.1 integrase catalytic region [Desulfobacula toluolica Tol2]CCK79849.1 IstA3: transposase for insertion sequence element IS21 [Desulfobacula toluolica Tol2]
MIDYETYVQIRNYFTRDGLTYSQISNSLDLDPRTVARWANQKRYQPRKSSPRKSKLDPFKNTILQMLEKHPYSSRQVFQRITEDGFAGGITIVEDYVRKVRPPKTKAYLKLYFAPGECAQVDWGSYGTVRVGSTTRRLSLFVMVMCHSRMMYVEFTVSQTMEHFLGCHQNAFEFFGKVPEKVMVDNLKSAVLKRIVGKAPVFNPRYLDFADYHGFTIIPCNVRKGNEKGRVENAVGYVKKNLLNGLEISDFKIMEPLCKKWLDTVANVRCHRETGKKPCDMYAEERPHLHSLPAEPYDIGVIRQVRASKQYRVTIDTNYYTVPAQLAGVALTAKLYPDRICFYHDNKLVGRHVRSYDRRKDVEDPDHSKILLNQRKKAKDQVIYMRFLSLSDKAQEYFKQLQNRRLNASHHVRQIVALSEIYSREQVAMAIEDAFSFSAFSCEYIANLLEQRSRPSREPGALYLTHKSDLLDLTIQAPDIDIYTAIGDQDA